MRWLIPFLLLLAVNSFAQRVDPILAMPITTEFIDDSVIRGYFADVVRQGGYGHWKTERAAFLVRGPAGDYRCVAWPNDGRLYRQEFQGAIPDRTVAIIHTHPSELPSASAGDVRTAIKISVPIFVLTPLNIYMITARGAIVPIVENRLWAVSGPSDQCLSPSRGVSRSSASTRVR